MKKYVLKNDKMYLHVLFDVLNACPKGYFAIGG
jgi:hypothetical protein